MKMYLQQIRIGLVLSFVALVFCSIPAWSDVSRDLTPRIQDQDAALNHLVDPPGYRTATLGELGGLEIDGNGRQPIILIPGLGFGGSQFRDFLDEHRDQFQLYRVTLPGFGGTAAPPSPPESTSFGAQTWTNSVVERIEQLIADDELDRPIIIGHWITGTQIALRLALRNPDTIGAVVLLAGTARYEPTPPEDVGVPSPSLEERIEAIDKYVAPRWFKSVTRETWDDNNFLPGDYVKNPVVGLRLWREAARPPLHVWVRYLCEFYAQDVSVELPKLTVPTLLIQPGLDNAYQEQGLEYLQAYLHTSWSRSGGLEFVEVASVPDSRIMLWHDEPVAVETAIIDFLGSTNLAQFRSR